MEWTLTTGCWIKFRTYLAKVICLYDFYNLLYHPSYIRYNDRLLHSSGNSCLFHKELISLSTTEQIVLPPTSINSAGIWSIPGDCCPFSISIAILTSNCSAEAQVVLLCVFLFINPMNIQQLREMTSSNCEKLSVLFPIWLYSTIAKGAWLWQTVLSHCQHNFIINKTS